MEIKAHFTQIGEVIQHELNSAQSGITAAIAWLTDPELFNALVRAARRGVLVRIFVWSQYFYNGSQGFRYKLDKLRVRAVRAF